MLSRRSIRAFSRVKPNMELILNAVRTAASGPSGANSQPWHFAIIRDAEIKKRLRAAAENTEREFYEFKAPAGLLDDLKPFRTNFSKPHLTEAPYLIAVFSRSVSDNATASGSSYYARESTGIAVGLLLSSLQVAGLSTLTHTPNPMTFLNECLGLDRSYRPYMIVVVGYKADEAFVPDLTKKRLEDVCTVF
ncbi:MAG: nitroreductase family protein [Proteobacteria bacterium]|nr:MAG: nitroreductase family protein [Pseudomonadota bacterium]